MKVAQRPMAEMRQGVLALAVSVLMCWGSTCGAQTVPGCGSLQNAFGPFDYRDPVSRGESLTVVETYHFTPEVESLSRGSSGTVAGDLDYTLRAFPNHHRALAAVARYALAGGALTANRSVPSADCYFKRAVAFRGDDETVRMLYANYLAKRGDNEGARQQYEEALRLAPSAPEVNYNAGLFFVTQGDLERAKQLARVAYDGGYPLPGLKRRIAAEEERRR